MPLEMKVIPILTQLCLVESSTSNLWTGRIPIEGGPVSFSLFLLLLLLLLLLPCVKEIPVVYTNRVDPDQTPRSVASDLGLHCLPISLLWDARLKWVKF